MFKAKNRILANMFDQWQLSRLLVEDKFKHRIRIFVKYLFLGVWTWLESSGSLKSLKSPKNVHILINKKFSFFIFEWFISLMRLTCTPLLLSLQFINVVYNYQRLDLYLGPLMLKGFLLQALPVLPIVLNRQRIVPKMTGFELLTLYNCMQ